MLISLKSGEETLLETLVERCRLFGVEARQFGKLGLCVEAIPIGLHKDAISEMIEEFKEDICCGRPLEPSFNRAFQRNPVQISLAEAEQLWMADAQSREVELEMRDLMRVYNEKIQSCM